MEDDNWTADDGRKMPRSSKRTPMLSDQDNDSTKTAEAAVVVAPARSLMIVVVGFLLVFATMATKEGLSIRSRLGISGSISTTYPINDAGVVSEHEYATANRRENEKKSKSKRVRRGGPKIGAALAYRKQARALSRPL